MPWANNHGVRIHYELEGEGPPLILLHGLSEDLAWCRDYGYVESLKNDYKLILIDARGHGASDKPHNPDAYKLELFVARANLRVISPVLSYIVFQHKLFQVFY